MHDSTTQLAGKTPGVSSSFIEILEARIAPAGVLTYIDTDGDLVKISTSKGDHAGLVAAAHFTGASGGPQTLTKLDLDMAASGATFDGSSVSITVTKKAPMTGNGTVDVGYIDADDIALGAVTVSGDLDKISAGSNTAAGIVLKSLAVGSLGVKDSGAPDTVSSLSGTVGTVTVKGDVEGAFEVRDGAASAPGKIASLKIGGSLLGGSTSNTGYIQASRLIGAVTVTHDITGGGGQDSGEILGQNGIGNVTIGGSLLGGQNGNTGAIRSQNGGPIGLVKIAHDFTADPGNFAGSGYISASGFLKGVSVGGSVTGGGGQASGQINAGNGAGAITIHGSLLGGAGTRSGAIEISAGDVASIAIGGNIIGGGGQFSGAIENPTGTVGPVTVGGYIEGAGGPSSGTVNGKFLESVMIKGKLASSSPFGGSLIRGSGPSSGQIEGGVGGAGTFKLAGDLLGRIDTGGAAGSAITVSIGGSIGSTGVLYVGGDTKLIDIVHDLAGFVGDPASTVASLVVGGSITGAFEGNNDATSILAKATVGGSIAGDSDSLSGLLQSLGGIGTVTIAHDLHAGTGSESGEVVSNASIASLTIGGSVIGVGQASQTGGNDGAIIAGTGIGKLSIAHDLQGGPASHSGYIDAGSTAATIGSLTIGGSVIGDAGDYSGSIHAVGIKSLTIKKNLTGGTATRAGSILADADLGTVTVLGTVQGGTMLNTGYIGTTNGNLTALKIAQDLVGGAGSDSGEIEVHGALGALTIGGTVMGSATQGAAGDNSARIVTHTGGMGMVKIGKDLRGSTFNDSNAHNDIGSIESAGDITRITIGGSLRAGADFGMGTTNNDGAIAAAGSIGPISVKGDLKGVVDVVHDGVLNPAVIAARGTAANPLAIKSLAIGGSVSAALIAAGYSGQGDPENADAGIGPVTVSGTWAESSITAGVKNSSGANNYSFGGASDALISGGTAAIVASIASITIGSHVSGSILAGDHFGFVAEQVGSLKIAGHLVPLTTGPDNDNLLLDGTDDVGVHEV